MAVPQRLMTKIASAVAGGSMAIAVALIGGHDGLEGREYVPYYDVVGVLTVCDGHTGKDIILGKRYSDTECDALLHQDLIPVFAAIDRIVKVPMSDFRKAALASFGYNVGITAMTNSTMVKKLNRGDTSGACDELRRWIKAGGKVWKGLVNRREVERELCLMP
ncbi:TPA: lysozyme [Yersinia enterocolitica]|uniref:lysozyme n=1 Tax=Yersinia enterocolitica TaxID=630 RepID=UPI002876D7BF|nr:lysozyme [Yersinia enterocolitica]EKN3832813.1 lysozyme [Yersinia enterocolitica]HDW7089224.1 lysozyme [Yersinia enterocolitica]HEB0970183.1 lysozyme [Yersinia enterocolitica]HEB1847237.1 lysozyme [Yersinia enterocolitica]